MALAAGTRLGPYEVLGLIGAGGMGEVYRARDIRLDRSVAIKVLPTELSADPERRARFEREAKTIAGLTHPHICTLHDVGDHEGAMFLVMEHLAGQTLAARLAKGPLPLDEALEAGIQIADALGVAHKQGIIHRDLKPGNVMLTKAGAKLLDFGLAKLRPLGVETTADFSSLLTQASPETEKGTIFGTLAYMAPEQIEGQEADGRSDLFAFGALLYEMLTGTRAFTGTRPASVISAIMSSQPAPISTFQPLAPPLLERLVRQCLAKAPEDRPDTAHDVANDLRWLRDTSGISALTGDRPRGRRVARTGLHVAVGVLLLLIGAGATWLLRPAPPGRSILRVSVSVAPAEELNAGGVDPTLLRTRGGSHTALSWTPDGQALVFVGRRASVQQLYVRRLDAAEARPLDHTEGAQAPAVSPDGEWVAFWAGGELKKVPLGGGPAATVASFSGIPTGLTWDGRGGLLAGAARAGDSIWAYPADGKPIARTATGGLGRHTFPSLLPGGRVLLYCVRRRGWSWGDEEVIARMLATGDSKLVLRDATDPRYVPTGHLLFLRRGVLYAMPFDAERAERRGPEVPVIDGVAQALTAPHAFDITGAGQFAVAPTGTLAWIPSPVVPPVQGRLVTVDRRGQVTVLPAPESSYAPAVRLSPDQRRLVVQVRSLTEVGLWISDLTRPAPLLRLAPEGEAAWPTWAPDGREIVFSWFGDHAQWGLGLQPANGTAQRRLLVPGRLVTPASFQSDGRRLAAVQDLRDIVLVTVEDGTARVEPLVKTGDGEGWPEFSPDGHWLAYVSNVTGRFEVYVRPYPETGGAVPLSVDGGSDPAWHPGGREVFFLSLPDRGGKCRMMAVDFAPGSPPRVGRPRELFTFDERDLALSGDPVRGYDVAADGLRFYAVQRVTPPPAPVVTHINVITNWFEELKAKVPVATR